MSSSKPQHPRSSPPSTTTTSTTNQALDKQQGFVCGICQHVLEQPLITPCSHRFCARCIDQLFADASSMPMHTATAAAPPHTMMLGAAVACPTCRLAITKPNCKPVDNKLFLEALGRQITQCSQHHIGCQWQGQHQSLIAHRASCKFNACVNHHKFGRDAPRTANLLDDDTNHPSSTSTRQCTFVGTINDLMMHQDQCVAAPTHNNNNEEAWQPTNTRRNTNNNNNGKYRHQIESMLSTTIVQINAGGQMFHTTQHTLQREQQSLLSELMSGSYDLQLFGCQSSVGDGGSDDGGDECGAVVGIDNVANTTLLSSTTLSHKQHQQARQTSSPTTSKPIFLDCDPTAFAHVLYWLRTYVDTQREIGEIGQADM
jgi:hypothetical protein